MRCVIPVRGPSCDPNDVHVPSWQCPKSLECTEHHDVNERFLNGYQLLKRAQTMTAGVDYKERDLEVQRMKLRLRDLAQNKYAVPYKVCIFISWENSLRKRAGRICRSRLFDRTTMLCIAVNCMVLALDRPRRSALEALICEWIQMALTVYFWAEMLIKCLWYGPALYSANSFNKIDIIINMVSGVELIVRLLVLSTSTDELASFRILRIFRGLRALRPLRLLTRSPGLRIMLTTVTSSVRPVLNVMCVSVIVFSVLGILGMQVLSGRLARCSDPTIFERRECVGRSEEGLARRWETNDVNFDWIGDALVSVYVISSGDHWPRRMYAGMDSTTPDTGPSHNASSFIAMFYVLIILIGTFFILSVGTGVLINTFNAVMLRFQLAPANPWRLAAALHLFGTDPQRLSCSCRPCSCSLDARLGAAT